MDDDERVSNERLNRLVNSRVGIVSAIGDDDFERLVEASRSGARVRLEQTGPWPEFIFRGSVIVLNIDGKDSNWLAEEVSVAGVTLRCVRQSEDLLRP